MENTMSAHDPMRGRIAGHGYPATKGYAVTPSDEEDLEAIPRGVMVNGAGVINGILAGDTVAVLYPVAAGIIHQLRFKRILASDTTATGIVAVY